MKVEEEGRKEMETIETLKFMFSRTLCLEELSFSNVPEELWPVIIKHLKNLQKISLRWEHDRFEHWKLPHLKEAVLHPESRKPVCQNLCLSK
jgi:hypothetical protein